MADYAPVDLVTAEQVPFELNGRKVSAPAGTMLVDAANAHGVEVPVFCYEPRLGPAIGACRMCLVEVEGSRGLQTACSTPVQADMVVRTNSPAAVDGQDGVLEFLLENHPLDCPVCDKGGECPLQDRTFRFGPGRTRFVETKRHFPKPLDLSSLITLDRERCISCFRCVRFSQDVAEDRALIMEDRGAGSEIATFTGELYEGRFTGNVIDLCPVGALTSIPYRFVARPWDIANTPSVCGHCPVGCNTELTGREGSVGRVTGRPLPNDEVEEGWLCDKGRFAYDADRAPDRLTRPIIRDAGRTREVSLDDAVDAAALVLGQAGPVGVVVGPTATVEEGFIAQELAAGPLGGAPVQRLGLPGGALAPLRALPAAQLGDLDRAGVVVIVGGDPANQQPVVELRARKARRRGARVVTVGPRPHALEAPGLAVRIAPGGIGAAGAAQLAAEAEKAGDVPIVVLWDEVDLAAEPAGASALAAQIARLGASQIELGAGVNGAGLRALGLPASGVLEAAAAGELGCILTIHAEPTEGPGAADWGWALGRVRAQVVIGSRASGLADQATVVLPAGTPYESEGVYVSMNGRAQRLRPIAAVPEGAAPGWELLIALAHRLGAPPAYRTPARAFAAAAAARPALAGLDYDAIGHLGRPLNAAVETSPGGPDGRSMAPSIDADGNSPESGGGLPLVTTRPIFGDATSHRSPALAAVRTDEELVLHPAEAARRGLAGETRVRLHTAHGECVLPLRTDEAHPEGAAFVALGSPGGAAGRLLPADGASVHVEIARAV